MSVDLEAPDHTTLSRRGQQLDISLDLAATDAPIHLVVDSTRLSIVGEGEWAAAKHAERGKRGWKKEFGYHRQGRVENAFFRHKAIIGHRLRARHPKSQETEVAIACNILNRTIALGMPVSGAMES